MWFSFLRECIAMHLKSNDHYPFTDESEPTLGRTGNYGCTRWAHGALTFV